MRTKNASRQSYVSQPNKVAWVVAATLIAALLLGAFAASPRALASGIQDSEQPFVIHSDPMTTPVGRSSTSSSLPYTNVAKFYVERMRVQASQTSAEAANPELMFARRSYGAAASLLADNPELMFARGAYVTQSELAANPELIFARGAYGVQNELAASPELMFARQSYDYGYLVCSVSAC
jgi:hypothetical protein